MTKIVYTNTNLENEIKNIMALEAKTLQCFYKTKYIQKIQYFIAEI